MPDPLDRAAAIVGVSAILPDAPDAATFWSNVTAGRYSISEVDPARWDPALYYDADHDVPERTYSKIGGWVRDWDWDPLAWKLPIPPKVSEAMDEAHKWAVACTRMALADAGWPERAFDQDRTAVIIGNAISGEKHYLTAMRTMFPELARELERTDSFAALPEEVRATIERELHVRFNDWLPGISEDTMPGELGNCIAGRIANLFNFHGPNFTIDAACASALAAMDATMEGLMAREFDVAITGGVDRNMGAHTFIKFCAIGALSPSGTRPYDEGADGFVMGEGAALFVVKRLADAVSAGDRIYAVVRGVGSASDGKGKGITAPNPIGQRFAVQRAWQNAGISPANCGLVEGHGTSTRVGDVVEIESLIDAFEGAHLAPRSIALGSVKSNIGHLKAAAGAAGMLKATLALHHAQLPPSIGFETPNPNLDWTHSPFAVNTELRDWKVSPGRSRVAGVSAFGFGGTNFHVVMEDYDPSRAPANGGGRRASVGVPATPGPADTITVTPDRKPPLRGALVLGAATAAELANELRTALAEARLGRHLDAIPPSAAALRASERIAIDYADGPDLVAKAELALKVLSAPTASGWDALRGRGIHRGSGAPGKVAFLYTGQGSQYTNMLGELRRREPVVADCFEQADAIMEPLLEGRRLSDIVFPDRDDPNAVAHAEAELRRTEIQQPAVIAVDTALTRLLAAYGIVPDMVMGHSVGEYAALVTAGTLTFEHALEAVSARGREMAHLELEDPGAMVAAMAPLADVQAIVDGVDGYAVLANVNSTHQVVIGGATDAVGRVAAALQAAGHTAIPLPVSHAFHTEIVAPASVPLRAMLERLGLREPQLPVVANVTGDFYPTGDGATAQMLEMLSRQVASPVQFIDGLRTLYQAGARVFVESGPKHALQGFAADVLGAEEDVVCLASNHPKQGDIPTFNNALCGLWAAGVGVGREPVAREHAVHIPAVTVDAAAAAPSGAAAAGAAPVEPASGAVDSDLDGLFAEFLERGRRLLRERDGFGAQATEPVVITGAALGLPGHERLFDDANVGRLLDGEQGIDLIPGALRREMLDKHITRLVKGEDGGASWETIDRLDAVIKLAARSGAFDLREYGVDDDRLAALGRATQLAIAAGIDALRDAGIPLVLRYKTTSTGSQLPDRWSLPDEMRDETGVIFASAFPGLEEMADEVRRYTTDHMRHERLAALESLHARMLDHEATDPVVLAEVERRIHDLNHLLETEPYTFNRRFIFRVLSMGHSQFAELIGARGPNTQINSACASTTQAISLAEDWIRTGRCKRVVVIAADDATSDTMIGWIGSAFLATGAAATDELVEDAALPFDRRRHGMIVGMGAAGLVVESSAAARERALTPICEVLGTVTANSAFHGTRLDLEHIGAVMEKVVSQAEARGIRREEIAGETVFISHETYTPARGGSAAAEIHALRQVFGADAGKIVIANVKGFTGHPMGVGLEDVLAVKSLETGVVPPVPNFHEPDPDLGDLNLSHGGAFPIRYALRLAAGFGSQISMTLMRWTPALDGRRRRVDELGYEYRITDRGAWSAWLKRISGQDAPRVEVVQHRLRVADAGVGAKAAPVSSEPAAVPEAPVAAPASQPAPAAPAPEPVVAAPEPVVAAESEPVVAAPEPVAAVGAVDEDQVVARVLAIVAEQTGYPEDLLDMDLDLEADLGVDTVKQAEVIAQIRDEYGIERDDALKLRDYPTINHVVGFVRERAGAAADAAAPEPAAPPAFQPAGEPVAAESEPVVAAPEPVAAVGAVDEDQVVARVLAIVAEQTGYPEDLLDMDLDLEADLGVDTVKQAEVIAQIRDEYGIERDDALKLRDYPTINHVVGFVRERAGAAADAAAPEPAAPPAFQPAAEPVAAESEPVVAAPEPVAAVGAVDEDQVVARVLAIVAEQTGYPEDLLDMGLDLEADLGVDTVKQAEVIAQIRDEYGIERDDALKLRDYPTINHVVGFVRERTGRPRERVDGAAAAGEPDGDPAPATAAPAPPVDDERFPRRVPVPVLRPPLEYCVPTGVALGEGSRVVLMGDADGAAAKLGEVLAERGVEVMAIEGAPAARELEDRLRGWLANGALNGVYWLPALDDDGPLDDAQVRRDALHRRVKLLAVAMRALPDDAFLIAASRLGGRHGYGHDGALGMLGGAVTGFTKALAQERAEITVKAIDFERDASPEAIAQALIDETLHDSGAVEIGHSDGLRWSIGLHERPVAPDGSRELAAGSVFLVTGAAGSIVQAVIADLAPAAPGSSFHLFDLVGAPDPDDGDIARFADDLDGLKHDLTARIKERGKRPTPKLIDRELARIERAATALETLRTIERAGGSAHWHQVDLTDPAAVAREVGSVLEAGARVDVLLHCAGLEISHALADKPQAEFDLVFDVKAHGWLNLLAAFEAAGSMPEAAVVFGSIAGRFGNRGQTDYAAANDLLCKSISNLNRRQAVHAVAIDWTAWAEIGMASRGSIPKVMAAAKVDMLPPAVGAPVVRRELTGGGGEVLVAGSLGAIVAERHPTGGLDLERASAAVAERGEPMVRQMTGFTSGGELSVTSDLDPSRQAFLFDHRIDGTPVLPGVMGMEGFAEVACLLAPGYEVAELEDVELLAPFKFYRDQPRAVILNARLRDDGGRLVADCELIGRRELAGQGERETRHFTARVRLARAVPDRPEAALNPATADADGRGVRSEDVYKVYFHGPAYQVLDRAWRENGQIVGRFAGALPADHDPVDVPLELAPRLIELCFQTAGMWELGTTGRMGLPSHLDRVLRFGDGATGGPVWAVVTPREHGVDAEIVDGDGRVMLRIEGYRTSEMPGELPADALAPIRHAMGEE